MIHRHPQIRHIPRAADTLTIIRQEIPTTPHAGATTERPALCPSMNPSLSHCSSGDHEEALMEALNIRPGVLHYGRSHSERRYERDFRENTRTPEKPPDTLLELQYLITYGISNNFYYNVILYCKKSGNLIVAVEDEVYWWDGGNMVSSFFIAGTGRDILCVGSCGAVVLIGINDGAIYLVERDTGKVKYEGKISGFLQCCDFDEERNMIYLGGSTGMIFVIEGREIVREFQGFFDLVTGMYAMNEQ